MADILIVGGGITGMVLALALSTLAEGRLAIELVDAVPPQQRGPQGLDARTLALSHETCQQLASLGIWQKLAAQASPIRRIHVSDRGQLGLVSLNAADYHLPVFGQVLEQGLMSGQLFDLLTATPGIRWHCPARVTEVQRTEAEVSLQLDTQLTLTGKLLIAADGSDSSIANALNLSRQTKSYHQVALVTNVLTEIAHEGCAFERFTEQGPLALLPLSQGRCALVWCSDEQHQSLLRDENPTQFLQRLQQAFGWRLGAFTQVGERQIFPLQQSVAERHISHRLALIGNAAQTLHPVAGQGLNLGLRDVMTLARIIQNALVNGEDPGSYRVLQRYQQQREPDQGSILNFTDSLVHVFSNRYFPLVAGRNLGLFCLEHVPTLKSAFIRRTLQRSQQ